MLELTTTLRSSNSQGAANTVWVKLYYKDKERGGLYALSVLRDPHSRTEIAKHLLLAVRPEAGLQVQGQVDRLLTEAIERYK